MHQPVWHSTTVRSAHTVFMCFVFIWEQTATCATYSINWSVFITEMKSVYSAVRTGSLNKAVCASCLKGQILAWRRFPRTETCCQICINPLNAELNPICLLLALLGAHHIFHVSGLRVNAYICVVFDCINYFIILYNRKRRLISKAVSLLVLFRDVVWTYACCSMWDT